MSLKLLCLFVRPFHFLYFHAHKFKEVVYKGDQIPTCSGSIRAFTCNSSYCYPTRARGGLFTDLSIYHLALVEIPSLPSTLTMLKITIKEKSTTKAAKSIFFISKTYIVFAANVPKVVFIFSRFG